MSRPWLAAAGLLLAAVLSHAAPPGSLDEPGNKVLGSAQQPTFRASVDLVTVDVSVREGSRAIKGLKAVDFEILDNDIPQEISDLSYEKLPIDVTVGLDVSESVKGVLLDRLRSAVRQLVGDLTKQDRLKLVTFNQRVVRAMDFTADLPAVSAAVKVMRASGGTSLLDAIAVALVSASDTTRRQLVVIFSDGGDVHSISDESMVSDIARRGIAMLNLVRSTPRQGFAPNNRRLPVQMPDPAGTPAGRFYTALTAETGGLVVPLAASPTGDAGDEGDSAGGTGGDVVSVFRRLLSDFRSCYVLRFTARGVARGGYHTLTVRVKRPGHLDVRARRGYFGGVK
jgi:VWFA-related protein